MNTNDKTKLCTFLLPFFLVCIAVSGIAAVSDYEGVYSGTFSGTDSGTWSVKIDSAGAVLGVAWSDIYNEPTVGSGSVDENGVFTATMTTGSVISGTIAEDGIVQGTWSNSLTNDNGTLTGRKNNESDLQALSGTYTGTYSGTDSGTWEVILDSDGDVSATSYSEVYNQSDSGIGIFNSTGELIAGMTRGAVFRGVISSSGGVSGNWVNSSTGDSGTVSGSKVVEDTEDGDGGGGGGGGCFIGAMN